MSDPIMRQIDAYNNWKDYEVTITYTVYIEAHNEDEAEGIASDNIRDYIDEETPYIEANKIN